MSGGTARGRVAPLVAAALLAVSACGEEEAPAGSPYVGEEARDIRALGEDEVNALLAGEGMGFALAAELNGFPGPRHVLDAAAELGLDDDQRARVEAIFDGMTAEAVRLGQAIVEGERELDRLFRGGGATEEAVAERTAALGTLRGRLRNVHLQAHLRTTPVLTEHQGVRYQEIRGYEARSAGDADHDVHGGH